MYISLALVIDLISIAFDNLQIYEMSYYGKWLSKHVTSKRMISDTEHLRISNIYLKSLRDIIKEPILNY